MNDVRGVEEILAALGSIQRAEAVDNAIVKAIEAIAHGALASDRQLLDLIVALIDRVQQLEALEAQRHEQYLSLVQRQQDLVQMATKAIKDLESLGDKYFKQTRKDIH